MKTGITLCFFFFISALAYTQEKISGDKEIKIKVFQLENSNEYGYDILVDGKLYIHQPHMPALNSTRGFISESDAYKTAGLMVNKIKNNIMPPSVTTMELDSLGIDY